MPVSKVTWQHECWFLTNCLGDLAQLQISQKLLRQKTDDIVHCRKQRGTKQSRKIFGIYRYTFLAFSSVIWKFSWQESKMTMCLSTLINGSKKFGARKLNRQTRNKLAGKWANASQWGVDLFSPRPASSLLVLLAKISSQLLQKSMNCCPQYQHLIKVFVLQSWNYFNYLALAKATDSE